MTRAKTKPPVRKPVFDEESVLRFAAMETSGTGRTGQAGSSGKRGDRKGAIESDPDRESLSLTLKPEVVSRLRAEAERKEKTVDQIVEKLVTKHLGKH